MYCIMHQRGELLANKKPQWETFWDDRGQQTYRVNPLFSELCACSELRKQWKFTRYVCCHLALESLLLTKPGVRSTRANDSQLFAQTFFYRLNDWCVYAMSIWRRPEMKMARTIRRFFLNFVFAAIVLFLTSLHQLINFVIPNLHYHPPKIQCNYVCDKEIIP